MTAGVDILAVQVSPEPLDARVSVRAVHLTRGVVFQVVAEWHGRGPKPADGQPDMRGSKVDYYDAASRELAHAIAGRAYEQLRVGFEPDLRAIAAELKRSRPELQTLTRLADGAVLLGDTPPDEAA